MRVDTNRLKGSIAANGMTQEAVAHAIGIDNSTFCRKMKCDGVTFSVGQMHKLIDLLKITPEVAVQIFLCEDSQ